VRFGVEDKLDLLFVPSGAGYRVRVLDSPAGSGDSAHFTLPLEDLDVEWRSGGAAAQAAKKLGGQLFDAAFTGKVGECLRRSLDRAEQQGRRLRIQLRLSDCPELAELPWELLYAGEHNEFLALSTATPIVRYPELSSWPRPMAVTLPLRILTIKSEPAGQPPLAVAKEWDRATEALAKLAGAGRLVVTELANPTLAELRAALTGGAHHILHVMAHGRFTAGLGGTLVLARPDGRGKLLTAEDLAFAVRDQDSLRLVVLNSCEGARGDPSDPFAGLSDTLLRRNIPAVIAMRTEFTDKAAAVFAPALYRAIADGHPIDIAVTQARQAIREDGLLDWATPVLFLRSADARLFDLAEEPADPGDLGLAAANAEDWSRRGADLCRQHDYGAAAKACREAISLQPGLAVAHAGLARALIGLGRLDEAMRSCREAIRLDASLAQAHANLARALLQANQGDPEGKSEAAYRTAIRLEPVNASWHNNLGFLLLTAGRASEAAKEFAQAIRLDPADSLLHLNSGDAYHAMGESDLAEAAYRQAILLNPDCSQAREKLRSLQQDRQRRPER
jgi:tetratricopeptide (TPR) repeat protein